MLEVKNRRQTNEIIPKVGTEVPIFEHRNHLGQGCISYKGRVIKSTQDELLIKCLRCNQNAILDRRN